MSRDKDDRRRNRLQKRARNNSNNIINFLKRRRKKIKVSEVLKYMKGCGICLILLTLYVNIYTVTIVTTTTTTTTTHNNNQYDNNISNMNPFSTSSLYYMCQRIYFFFFPKNRRMDVNGIPIEFYNRYFFHGVREDHLFFKKKKQSALLDMNFAALGAENNKEDEKIWIGSDFYPSDDLKQGRQKCLLTVVFMDTGQLFTNDILTTDTHNNNNNNNNHEKSKPTYQNSLWYSLESIAAYTPYACVLIQTTSSSCIIWDHFLKKKKKSSSNSMDAKEIIISDENGMEKFVHRILSKKIYKNALPLFRDMIHKGYVRLNLLDPIYKRNKKYVSSDNNNMAYKNNNNKRRPDVQNKFFSSSSSVLEDFCTNPPHIVQNKHLPPHNYLLHVDFWKDEFIPNVDSDTILMMRGSGNVLCHHFDISLWSSSSYALVGSVWPYESNENVPRPMEGMCQHLENKWNIWSNNAKKNRQNNIANYTEKEDPTNISSSGRCTYNNFIPIGTNGITLRDRKWAIKAIETCPHIKYSGINLSDVVRNDIHQLNNNNNNQTLCKVIENVEEHVYFSTIFNGIGAPLPNIYEASIFAGEMLFPEQAFKIYYGGGARNTNAAAFKIMDEEEKMRIIEQRWGSSSSSSSSFYSGKILYERMHTPWNYYFSLNNNNHHQNNKKKKLLKTIPIGVSKLDQYHPMKDLLQSNDQFHQECVFLPYLLYNNGNDAGSKAKKYKKLTRKERWRGIGT